MLIAVIIFKSRRLSSLAGVTQFLAGIISIVKSRLRQILYMLVLIALLAVPRLVAIDRFATIDEPYWLTAGSDFYYALGQRAFANTVYDYHPAVTTMWVVAAAMLVYFPQYRGYGQGYFDVYKDTLERFLLSHDHTPLGLLTTGRVIQTFIIVVLLLVIFWFLRRLLGDAIAWAATLLISFDPFFLGHSRLLNHEGMLSVLVLTSVLAMLAYHYSERRFLYVLVSGAAAGFAQLTKSSSIVILPLIGLLFLLDMILRRDLEWKRRVWVVIREFAAWLAMLCVVYFVFWPGMWVAPGEMLYQVFGNALSYAFEGSRLSVTGGVQAAQFHLGLGDTAAFIRSILWRTTPVIWIGFLLGIVAAIRQRGSPRVVLIAVFLAGFLFVLLFGVASGRNSAHYVLTAYVALDIIAATGYVYTSTWLAGRLRQSYGRCVMPLAIGVAVIFQAASAAVFFPYYYTYYSPIMEAMQPGQQNPSWGYGEGLDLAAAYLAQKPDAAKSTVVAFYGRGAFSYFYPGETEPLKPVYGDMENVPQLIQVVQKSKYIVLYYELEHQRDSPANVMRALADVSPEKSIWLNGIEYIRIYRVQDLSQHFYTALAQ
jgi:4-amino-4-deoxy-L-arabinose transferase-like glycosyltransferase